MSGASHRWWGPKSDFPWEEDALRYICGKMPEADPYRAWHTFTFTARTGHVRELDLFMAAPGGLFLVEIKSHPGMAANNGSTWIFRDERTRTVENPLHFTDLKAKELRGQLEQAARDLRLNIRVPRIEAGVFLSAENLRCGFDEFQRARAYGRDELAKQTGLPGIWGDFLKAAPRRDSDRVTPTVSGQLEKLLHKIGVHGLRKHRKVGPYLLDPRAFDAGVAWEDYLAENTALPADQSRRVRIYLSELRATPAERESARRAARREYLALQGIAHDGIVRAEQYSDEHEAGPAIVFRHGRTWQRLDHFIAARGPVVGGTDLPVETRVEMVRQLAEALDHAHRRHLYHRALAARCVYVELDGTYPRLRICDWQLAARPANGGTAAATALGSSGPGQASLAALVERSAGPYLAPEFGSPDAAPAQLDIFGLGALSFLVLTGQPPAGSRAELAARLTAQRALSPSAIADAISPSMDDLVRGATAVQPVDRLESVREFLGYLDLVEDELTAPERAGESDPLEAGRGAVVAGWTVTRVLGKGSTARALLAERDGHERVLKVALNDSAAQRLAREAAQLRKLADSHIVKLIEGPVRVGDRALIVLERAGERTLADEIRQQGTLTIDELESLGEHLLRAVDYLDGEKVWHRDIKPDNLALRELPRKGRRLVLFDFSLAGTPDTDISVGTTGYLDPFLGTGRRPRYDNAAERYAVAVTLHEMASGELPSWGDSVIDAKLLDPAEELPQLAEDTFDPVLRDRLVAFFHRALHRDASKRFGSLREMARAWSDVFRDLDQAPPLTTRHTVTRDEADESVGPDEARDAAARLAAPDTPLAAAGLTARALSIAQQQLGVGTVGELVRVPARRVMKLRGIGITPRNELVRRAREWRLRLGLAEFAGKKDNDQDSEREPADAAGVSPDHGGRGAAAAGTDLDYVSLDEVARQLVPESGELAAHRSVLGLAGPDGRPSPVPPWADQREIAQRSGLSDDRVAGLLARFRERWAKSAPALTSLRGDVVTILGEHGRVLEAGQIAAALLARRGSELAEPAPRLALAAVCARAAIETEARRAEPRMVIRRYEGRVLVALSPAGDLPAPDEEDPSAPGADDLLDYAVRLGDRADQLASGDPLPGVVAIQAGLRAVAVGHGMTALSDTDLVALAAAASRNAAATARLELYPRDLPAERALRLSQAASYLGERGLAPDQLRDRVLGRFPELTGLPGPGELRTALRAMGYDVRITDGRYVLPSSTQASSVSRIPGTVTGTTGAGTGARYGAVERDEVWPRLAEASRRGGFVVVKARLPMTVAAREALRGMDGVTPVDVTAEFVAALRAITAEQGRPRWESVLAADSDAAAPAAKAGFGRLLDETWRRLEARICSAEGIVLLHDATPLARYTGGAELLARLVGAARRSDEAPHGLWLLCPMPEPRDPARLDSLMVGVIPGDAEQLALPSSFLAPDDSRRVS